MGLIDFFQDIKGFFTPKQLKTQFFLSGYHCECCRHELYRQFIVTPFMEEPSQLELMVCVNPECDNYQLLKDEGPFRSRPNNTGRRIDIHDPDYEFTPPLPYKGIEEEAPDV